MCRYIFMALCFFSSIARAQPPVDPTNTELVLLETYLHYFTVKEVFQQCGSVVPDQFQSFSKTFSVWEERNKKEITFVNAAFSKHFASRSKEGQELIDAAPTIVHDQYLSMPYDQSLCMNVLITTNTVRLMDYSLSFPEHLDILKTRLSMGAPNTAVNTDAVR